MSAKRRRPTSTSTTGTSSTDTTRDGSVYFGVAMGLYPNRHVADAAFSVDPRRRADQRVHLTAGSRRPPRRDPPRADQRRIVEPMRVLRLSVDAVDHGVHADLTFTARSAAVEEPHYWWRVGRSHDLRLHALHPVRDVERMDRGRRRPPRHVTPETTWGSRDRSWGIRPTGEPAPTGAPVARAAVLLVVGAGQLPLAVDPLRLERVRRRPPLARGRRDRAHRWHARPRRCALSTTASSGDRARDGRSTSSTTSSTGSDQRAHGRRSSLVTSSR